MKKLIIILFLTIICSHLKAQKENKINDKTLENLKLNSSPAFVALGIEPDNIQRPSSPTQFVAGLQNAMVDGKLQPNLAFEISPFQFGKDTMHVDNKQRFDGNKYLLSKKNVGQTILQTLSFSVGSSTTDQEIYGNLRKGTGLGTGVRFQILDGRASFKLIEWNHAELKARFYDKLVANIRVSEGTFDFDKILEQTIDDYKNKVLPVTQLNTFSEKDINNLLEEARKFSEKFLIAGISNNKEKIEEVLNATVTKNDADASTKLIGLNKSKNPLTKFGWIIEIAAGQVYAFQDNTFDGARHAKTAVWLTPSYRFDVSKDGTKISLLDIMAVGRATFNNHSAGVDSADYLDGGIKGSFTRERWSASIEYVYRWASKAAEGFDKKHTYRLVTGIDYKLSDAITFKFNFGSNFDGNTTTYTDKKKMFALGGLNFGLASLFKE